MKKRVENILLGNSKNKLQELEKLEKDDLKILFEISINIIDELKSILELNEVKSIDDLIKEVERIKAPSLNTDMNKKLDELQETLRKINSSL